MPPKIGCDDPIEHAKIAAAIEKYDLDKSKTYCVGMFGELAELIVESGACTGCACDCGDGYGCSHGSSGCDECNQTGIREMAFPSPVKCGDGYFQINPAKCEGCGKPLEHFDAGCKECADKCAGEW